MEADQLSFFSTEEAPSNREARRRAYRSSAQAEERRTAAIFETWWRSWPAGNKGAKSLAKAKFLKIVDAGTPVAELERQLANWQEARALFSATHGTHPPLIHASSFLNGKRKLWDDPWTSNDASAYWSAAIPREETWGEQWAKVWPLWRSGGFDALVEGGQSAGVSRRSFRALSGISGQLSRMNDTQARFAFRDAWQASQ